MHLVFDIPVSNILIKSLFRELPSLTTIVSLRFVSVGAHFSCVFFCIFGGWQSPVLDMLLELYNSCLEYLLERFSESTTFTILISTALHGHSYFNLNYCHLIFDKVNLSVFLSGSILFLVIPFLVIDYFNLLPGFKIQKGYKYKSKYYFFYINYCNIVSYYYYYYYYYYHCFSYCRYYLRKIMFHIIIIFR